MLKRILFMVNPHRPGVSLSLSAQSHLLLQELLLFSSLFGSGSLIRLFLPICKEKVWSEIRSLTQTNTHMWEQVPCSSFWAALSRRFSSIRSRFCCRFSRRSSFSLACEEIYEFLISTTKTRWKLYIIKIKTATF